MCRSGTGGLPAGHTHVDSAPVDSKDLIKGLVLLFLYFLVGPALGFISRNKPSWQRGLFALMAFMTISGLLKPGEWGFTLGDLPEFRGHARGFHFYFNEILAIALITASAFNRKKSGFKLFPPGLWAYLLYCVLSLVSFFSAPVSVYVFMSAFKAFKVILIFLAAYNYLRTERDLHFFVSTMAVTMIWEMIVVLKMKYLDHIYQVWGTFEHQNALAMYAIMIGMVLLGAGTGPKQKGSNLFLLGFLASAIVVECTLSRAGLVFFAIGTVSLMGLSLLEKITARRVIVISSVALAGLVLTAISWKTIMNRFNDTFNEDSKMTRVMLNEAARRMNQDFPLGVGWNNYAVVINHPYHYGDLIDDYFRKFNYKVDPNAAKGIVESQYYLIWAENGPEGILAYFLFIALFLYFNARCLWFFRHHFIGCVTLGIAMGCSMNYLQSTVERVLTQPRNMMLWMILLALTAKIETWRRLALKETVSIRPTAEARPVPTRRRQAMAHQ